MAISNFYLDTELTDHDFAFIAKTLKESGCTFEEAQIIDKEEVFPILYTNLLSVAGVWEGFDENWLLERITKRLEKRTVFGKIFNRLRYKTLRHMNKAYWLKLKKALVAP